MNDWKENTLVINVQYCLFAEKRNVMIRSIYYTIFFCLLTGVSISAETIQVESTKSNPSCRLKNDGRITLHIEGGKEPYLVMWNDGAHGTYREGLNPGVYAWTVTDVKGNTTSGELQLDTPEPMSVSFGNPLTNVNGTMALSDFYISGGQPFEDTGYIVRLNGNIIHEAIPVNGPQTMTLEIEDASGCTFRFPVTAIVEFTECYFEDGYDPKLRYNGLPLVKILLPTLHPKKALPMSSSILSVID